MDHHIFCVVQLNEPVCKYIHIAVFKLMLQYSVCYLLLAITMLPSQLPNFFTDLHSSSPLLFFSFDYYFFGFTIIHFKIISCVFFGIFLYILALSVFTNKVGISKLHVCWKRCDYSIRVRYGGLK